MNGDTILFYFFLLLSWFHGLQLVTQIFGEVLYYPGEECCLTEFPSPESLKNRVIISTKPPRERFESNQIKDNGNRSMLNESESSEEESFRNASPNSSRNEVETEDTVRQRYLHS